MKKSQISWWLWATGTALIVLSWLHIVSNNVGYIGFAIALAGSQADGDDLVQDTVERALKSLHLWEPVPWHLPYWYGSTVGFTSCPFPHISRYQYQYLYLLRYGITR